MFKSVREITSNKFCFVTGMYAVQCRTILNNQISRKLLNFMNYFLLIDGVSIRDN